MLRAWPRKQRPEAAAPHGASAWLGAPRADFWVVAAGGGTLLIALALVLQWRGDRELSAADVLFGELHLGATYEAIVRRRLWRRMPLEVLAMPLAIMAATYLLLLNGGSLLRDHGGPLLGAWHRGRQNLGIARYYQRHGGAGVDRAPLAARGRLLPAHDRGRGLLCEHRADARGRGIPRSLARSGAPVGPRGRGGSRRDRVPRLGRSGELFTRWRRRPSRRAVAGPGQCAGLRQRLHARRLDLVVRARPRHSPRGSVPLLHLCRGATSGRLPPFQGIAPEARRLARFARWPAIGLTSWALVPGGRGSTCSSPFLTAGCSATTGSMAASGRPRPEPGLAVSG